MWKINLNFFNSIWCPMCPCTALGIQHHNTGGDFLSFPISWLKQDALTLWTWRSLYFSSGFSSFACRILQWLRLIQIVLSTTISCWGKYISNFVFGVLLRVCSLEVRGMKGYGKHANKYLPTLHLFPNSLIIFNIDCFLESCCIAFFVAN